ncbi:hypothetical protein [Microbispora sp. CA-102843]|uniref:hypothetical protein n=1 Tax=Microbispora sp. CA-102843 TaxID=3239952 RepID=UPI003D8ECD3C
MSGAWVEGHHELPERFIPPSASLDQPAQPEVPMTLKRLRTAWERLKPRSVHVVCHPDDLDWIKAACDPMSGLVVVANVIVPVGQVYVFQDPAGSAAVTERVPVDQWTDDEWLRAMTEIPPDAPAAEGEAAVRRWREEQRP